MARQFDNRDLAAEALLSEGWLRSFRNRNAFDRRTRSGEKLSALILPREGMGDAPVCEPVRVEVWSAG